MMFSRWALLVAGAMSLPVAWAAPVTLYDGNDQPTAQGWTRSLVEGTVSVGVGATRFTTSTAAGARTSEMSLYRYAVGSANFIASIRLRANSVSPHNPLDAGLMFSVTDNFIFPAGNGSNRENMLYIEQSRIGWANDAGGVFAVNATQWHEYAVRYLNGQLNVYVDATYDDIVSGAATPVLSRTAATTNTTTATITFGDQTNDPNVDSDYEVDFVNFQDLNLPRTTAAVPAMGPWGALLLSGAVPLCLRIRSRKVRART